jgi:hypothetical protein
VYECLCISRRLAAGALIICSDVGVGGLPLNKVRSAQQGLPYQGTPMPAPPTSLPRHKPHLQALDPRTFSPHSPIPHQQFSPFVRHSRSEIEFMSGAMLLWQHVSLTRIGDACASPSWCLASLTTSDRCSSILPMIFGDAPFILIWSASWMTFDTSSVDI